MSPGRVHGAGSGLLILDTPAIARPQQRRLHTRLCRWAFRPGGRMRTYRAATAEEIRTRPRCSYC